MKRRTFLVLMGGSATVFSRGAKAQVKAQTIGLLSPRSREDSGEVLEAFFAGLVELGYRDGQNVRIEYRWGDGDFGKLPRLAKDLVDRNVDVIAAVGGEPAIVAAKHATSKIPIIFLGGTDPVQYGLVDSLSRPTGNMTGVTLYSVQLEPKKLQLLQEIIHPRLIGFLANPKSVTDFTRNNIKAAGAALHQAVKLSEAGNEEEIVQSFAAMAQDKVQALVVSSNPFFSTQRHRLIELSRQYSIPAIYDSRIQVSDGGLISYGTSYSATYHQAGVYVGRVLQGAKPSDLPVLLPTKFELAINMNTAKMFGLDIPLHLQQIADEVIE